MFKWFVVIDFLTASHPVDLLTSWKQGKLIWIRGVNPDTRYYHRGNLCLRKNFYSYKGTAVHSSDLLQEETGGEKLRFGAAKTKWNTNGLRHGNLKANPAIQCTRTSLTGLAAAWLALDIVRQELVNLCYPLNTCVHGMVQSVPSSTKAQGWVSGPHNSSAASGQKSI